MGKLFLVAKYEYLTNIKRRSFLFTGFGVPIFTIGIVLLVMFLSSDNALQGSELPESVGYVDQARLISQDDSLPENFIRFTDEEAARTALDNGDTGAYFVIPEDYMQTGNVTILAYGKTPDLLEAQIRQLLTASLLNQVDSSLNVPPERLVSPVDLKVVFDNNGRELAQDTAFLSFFLIPFIYAFIFVFSIQITSGFMMSGIVEEKGNRIMEILITSVTPFQLLAGKLIGLGLLGLTMLGIWMGIGLALLTFGDFMPFLSAIDIPPDLLLIVLIYFILSYFLIASILAAVGTVTGGEQESRQYAGLISIVLFVPFIFLFTFLNDPNGTVPTLLSMIPFTSAVAMIMRVSIASVPAYEVVLSLVILTVSSGVIVWVSAKIFHWSILLYGKRPSVREIWRAIRGSSRIMTRKTEQTGELS